MLVTPLSDFSAKYSTGRRVIIQYLIVSQRLRNVLLFPDIPYTFGLQIDVRTQCPAENADTTSKPAYFHLTMSDSDWIAG